jgi:hypothetical protein
LVIGNPTVEYNEEKTSDWLQIHGSTSLGTGAILLAHVALTGANTRRSGTCGPGFHTRPADCNDGALEQTGDIHRATRYTCSMIQ